MTRPSIPAQFEQTRQAALRAIEPIRSASLDAYFYGERTKAGGNLPPYYLVHFLLIELLRFARLGPAEKVAWSIPIDFKGITYVIEHRKLGLGVFAPDEGDH